MASSTGLNSDLLTAIEIARDVLNTYFDELPEAPLTLRDLLFTVKFIHDVLIESISFLRQCNRTFLGQQRFIRKLDQCREFIRRHSSLQTTPVDARSPSPQQQTWQLTDLADIQTAHMINQGLQMEMEKLITFIFLVAIKTSDNPPSASASAFRLSGHIQPASSNVEDIVRRLASLRKKAERRRNIAQYQGRSPDLSDLVTQLNEAWNLLCMKAGFVQAGRHTPLPGGRENPEGLLLSSNQGLIDEMIINLSRSSLHYPMNDRIDSVCPPQRYDSSKRNVSPGTSEPGSPRFPARSPNISLFAPSTVSTHPGSPGQFSIPRILPDQNQVILGEPALPVCIATWLINSKKGLKLQHWRLESSYAHRYLIWKGVDPAHVLKHYIPAGTLPYTKHISLRITERHHGHTITFDAPHRIIWTKNGETKVDERRNIEYYFVDAKDYKRFQEDVCDKHLLDTFNVDTVRTKQSTGYGDAGNQDLKLWCSRDEREVYSLSFMANHVENRQREYQIRWFSANPKFDDRRRVAELEFAVISDAASSPTSGRRPSLITRTFSFGRGGLSPPNVAPALSTSSNASPRASVSTLGSNASQYSSSGGVNYDYAPPDMINNLKYLHIEFTRNMGEAASEEDDYTRFKKLWDGMYRAATRPRTARLFSTSSVELASVPVAELDAVSTATQNPIYELQGQTQDS